MEYRGLVFLYLIPRWVREASAVLRVVYLVLYLIVTVVGEVISWSLRHLLILWVVGWVLIWYLLFIGSWVVFGHLGWVSLGGGVLG